MEQPIIETPLLQPKTEIKPVEGIKGKVQEWTEKGRAWLARLRGKVNDKPKEVIEEVAEAPKQQGELVAENNSDNYPLPSEWPTREEVSTYNHKPVELTPEQKLQAQRLDDLVEKIIGKNLIDSEKKGSMYHILYIDGEPDVVVKLLVSAHNAKDNFETQANINRQDDETCLAYFGDMVPISRFISVPEDANSTLIDTASNKGDLYIQLTQNLSTFSTLYEAVEQYGTDNIPQTLIQSAEDFIQRYALMIDETGLAIEAFDVINTDTLRVNPSKKSIIIADTNSLVDFSGNRQYVPYQLRSEVGNNLINEMVRIFHLDESRVKDSLDKINKRCKV